MTQPETPFLVAQNVALPISPNAGPGEWIDALDYYPWFRFYGGTWSWGGYVSWLLDKAGEDGFQLAMQQMGGNAFLKRYLPMTQLH